MLPITALKKAMRKALMKHYGLSNAGRKTGSHLRSGSSSHRDSQLPSTPWSCTHLLPQIQSTELILSTSSDMEWAETMFTMSSFFSRQLSSPTAQNAPQDYAHLESCTARHRDSIAQANPFKPCLADV